MMDRALAEIRERDASPFLSDLYNTIRTDTGFPQVNLIWRHLATFSGVLEWVWDVLQPAYRSGAVVSASRELADGIPGDGGPPVWDGLQGDDADDLAAIIASYNRANPENMIALAALLSAARGVGELGHGSVGRGFVASGDVRSVATSIRALPPRDSLDAELLAIVDRLSSCHGGVALGVRPSMYLHLAIWPEVLRTSELRLMPMLSGPDWQKRTDAVRSASSEVVRDVAGRLQCGAVRPEQLDEALRSVAVFTSAILPEMLVVGAILAGRSAR